MTSVKGRLERTAETVSFTRGGLHARAYSPTAGEIFWNCSATFGLIYDVLRNGEWLVTTDVTFDGLRVDSGTGDTLELTGTSRRADEQFANIECGGASRVSRTTDNNITSARIETGSQVTTVGEATWVQSVVRGLQSTSPQGPETDPVESCTALETLAFNGAATIVSTRFDNAPAMFEKRGELVRDERGEEGSSASARIDSDFGDGSTLAISLISDTNDEVQVDFVDEGGAMSFTDTYAFEAREDIPPILAD